MHSAHSLKRGPEIERYHTSYYVFIYFQYSIAHMYINTLTTIPIHGTLAEEVQKKRDKANFASTERETILRLK